jgi:hypothetical protein
MAEFSTDNQPNQRADTAANGRGNKRRLIMTDALMLALHREAQGIVDEDGKPTKRLNVIANQLVQKAAEGDIQAIKEVFDRTDGKAIQAMQVEGGLELSVIERVIVRNKPGD